jgi:hypothetical protein
MSKHVQFALVGLVCFLLGCLLAQHLPLLQAQDAEKTKKPQWTHALDLKCRKGREEDFDKAKVYGVEVFKDPNTDNLIYISETGSIAVIPAKGK